MTFEPPVLVCGQAQGGGEPHLFAVAPSLPSDALAGIQRTGRAFVVTMDTPHPGIGSKNAKKNNGGFQAHHVRLGTETKSA